jgi:prophage regulatory protein
MQHKTLPEIAYYRLPAVLAIFQISKSKVYDDIKKGVFPAPVKLGPRTSAWSAQSIRAYAEKIEKGDV